MNGMRNLRTLERLVAFFLLAAPLCAGCDREPKPKPDGGGSGGGGSAPQSQADLAISAIEVLPAAPQASKRFALNVYVRNEGQARSGAFDLAISMKDVGRSQTYPVGTFRHEGLSPGENVPVYTSTDRMVNNSGSYQVHAEIKPFQYQDANAANNVKIWAFTVQ